jgi:hypothetical protein
MVWHSTCGYLLYNREWAFLWQSTCGYLLMCANGQFILGNRLTDVYGTSSVDIITELRMTVFVELDCIAIGLH